MLPYTIFIAPCAISTIGIYIYIPYTCMLCASYAMLILTWPVLQDPVCHIYIRESNVAPSSGLDNRRYSVSARVIWKANPANPGVVSPNSLHDLMHRLTAPSCIHRLPYVDSPGCDHCSSILQVLYPFYINLFLHKNQIFVLIDNHKGSPSACRSMSTII